VSNTSCSIPNINACFDWLIKESLLPDLIPWFIGVRQRDCCQGGRDIEATVRQVIGGAVDAGEVIDLFAAAGLEDARLDIFSEEFLTRVATLEQKNLALETLRKLLTD
jgi:hypothetical protein